MLLNIPGERNMILESNPKPISCKELIAEFRNKRMDIKGEILKFEQVGDNDVYNSSIPFEINGETVIAGRVERRDSEVSKAVFFVEKDGVWVPRENTQGFDLQDPFVTKIGEELIFGGVRLIYEGKKVASWVTDFYRGSDLNALKLFVTGPAHMKDVRLIGFSDGRIGVFSRPQGKEMIEKYGCIAKIGFTVVNSLEEVTAESIKNAPLLEGHFLPDEWGGCNQMHVLKNGRIGVVGHIAWGEQSEAGMILHYYGISFAIDPDSRRMTPIKIISSRDCFPEGPSKQPRLKDVTFTAGIVRNDDGTAEMYTGLSDCQVGKAIIADPFLEYE